ncbi:MAG: DUF2846 domain-containing protein [Betaproteobacteria bacterium]|nr:DUF2846 domain-containing protein [Betaproteobacteria bacterium]
MKKNGLLGLLLAMMVLVTGCASVPMASDDADTQSKRFQAKPDKSIIYLYRNETFGGAIAMTVSLDDRLAGESAPKTYFMWEVEPGQHVLKSHAENVSILLLTTEAGKNYYVWQEVKLGALYARSRLQQVDEATGRQGVLECKRAQSAF